MLRPLGLTDEAGLEATILDKSWFHGIWARFRDQFLWDPNTVFPQSGPKAPMIASRVEEHLALQVSPYNNPNHPFANQVEAYTWAVYTILTSLRALNGAAWATASLDLKAYAEGLVRLIATLRHNYRHAVRHRRGRRLEGLTPSTVHQGRSQAYRA